MNRLAQCATSVATSVVVTLLVCAAVTRGKPESWYQERCQTHLGGTREVPVPRGRIDLLTTNMAVEVEFLAKFKEGIGQAMWYGWHTGRRPALALIATKSDRPALRLVRDAITNHSAIAVLCVDSDTGAVTR